MSIDSGLYYRTVAEVVGDLIDGTERDQIQWINRGPLGFVEVRHHDTHYILDNPRDGQPEFSINGVLVWRGYELRSLWSAVMDQDSRFRPAVPITAPRQLPDIRADEVVREALRRLRE